MSHLYICSKSSWESTTTTPKKIKKKMGSIRISLSECTYMSGVDV